MLPREVWRIVVKPGEIKKARKAGHLRYGAKAGGGYTSESEALRQFEGLQEMGIDCTLYRTPCFWEPVHEGEESYDGNDDHDGG